MGALPVPIESPLGSGRELPDYLPARMVNEFAYCPRLFFYEWVEGLFQESVDTVEGAIQHKRVDEKRPRCRRRSRCRNRLPRSRRRGRYSFRASGCG
jgi:hypothetical protein